MNALKIEEARILLIDYDRFLFKNVCLELIIKELEHIQTMD